MNLIIHVISSDNPLLIDEMHVFVAKQKFNLNKTLSLKNKNLHKCRFIKSLH